MLGSWFVLGGLWFGPYFVIDLELCWPWLVIVWFLFGSCVGYRVVFVLILRGSCSVHARFLSGSCEVPVMVLSGSWLVLGWSLFGSCGCSCCWCCCSCCCSCSVLV